MSAPPGRRRSHRPAVRQPTRTGKAGAAPSDPADEVAPAPRPVAAPVDGLGGERLRALANVLAPTTVLAALLYYFGYVTTYSRYAYFGVELDQIGLSQQDLVLRSVAALFLPAGVLTLLGLLTAGVRHVLLRRAAADRPAAATRRMRLLALAVAAAGALVLGRGVLGVVVPSVSAAEPIATSAGCLAGGALVVATALWFRARLGASPDPTAARSFWTPVWVIVALGLFWATNSLAAAYGRGQATDFTSRLPAKPAVTLDSTERLYLPPEATESTLPAEPGQRFRYRYRNLRLLVASGDRLFLVPATWRPRSGVVLVVQQGDSIRIRLGG